MRNTMHGAASSIASVCLLALLASSSCSTGNPQSSPDLGQDRGPGIDARLWPCSNPGGPCEAHDPCVISAVCKDDGLCYPDSTQNCDDGLDCTSDTCLGQGVCKNTPLKGFCAIAVKGEVSCFAAQAAHPADPCQSCDPERAPESWSPLSGGACDDGDLCTKEDYCRDGTCTGAAYSCSDDNACTDDVCDGKGGCSNPPKANVCAIGGGCQAPGDKAPGGCGSCDPQKSTSQWTLDPGKCLVDQKCYSAGDQASLGCGTCDPVKDPYQLTPPASTCDLGTSCPAAGEKGSSGCTVCDPTKSALGWSAVPGSSVQLIDFEAGLGGFSVSAPMSNVGWQVASLRAHTGKQSLYYGNPTTKNYDSGGQNSGTASRAGLVFPAGKKSALVFWLYLDVEQSPGYDVLTISAGGTEVWRKDATTMPASSYKRWIPVEVKLWALAGKTADLVFKFETKDGTSNSTEGVFLDDIQIIHGCGDLPQPSPFVMDGKLEASATKVAGGSGQMPLHLAYSGDHLYLATDDAGEGNDNFILISASPPGNLRPAPWSKAGSVAFADPTYFVADENDSSYSAWFKLGDTLMVSNAGPFVGVFSVGTLGVNGGFLEGSINLKEAFGSVPSVVYLAAVAYGNANAGKLAASAQTPPTKNSDGNVDPGEILKVSIPALQVIP